MASYTVSFDEDTRTVVHPGDAQSTEWLCAEYARLTAERQRHESIASSLKATLAGLELQLLSRFETSGMTSVSIKTDAGKRTIYLRRELWAAKKEGMSTEDVCAALSAEGLSEMVSPKYSAQTLSAWLRELDRDASDLPVIPDGLADVIETAEKYSLRVTR